MAEQTNKSVLIDGLYGKLVEGGISAGRLFFDLLASVLSRHFQEGLGIDGQPEEYTVIARNQFS